MNGAARRGAAVPRDVRGRRKSGRDVDVTDRRTAPISPPELVPAVLFDRSNPPLPSPLLPPFPQLPSLHFLRGFGGYPPKVRACKLRGFGGVPRLHLGRTAQQIHKRVNLEPSFRPSPTGISRLTGNGIVIWGDNTHIWGDNYNLGAEG